MNKPRPSLLLFSIFLLLHIASICAQPLTFRHYGVSEGLSSNTIYCTAQDQFGFMWFGTEDGLNKFDGYSFHHFEYNPTDTTTIPNNVIRALLVDSENNLWVGTDEGLCVFNQVHGKFTRFHTDTASESKISNNHITSLAEYGDNIFIGTNGGGVNIYNKQTKQLIRLNRNEKIPLGQFITALATDANGNLWIGSSGRGLIRYNIDQMKSIFYASNPADRNSISENYIASIYVSKKSNTVWVGTLNGGLNKLDPTTGQFTIYNNEAGNDASLSQNSVFSIAEDNFGALWVGTLGGGLNVMNTATGRFTRYQNSPNNPSSLTNNTVWSVMIERSGTLWIGTTYGLNTYDRSQIKFRTTTIEESLNSNVFAVCSGEEQSLWVGIMGNGLAHLNKFHHNTKTYRVADGLPSEYVTALCLNTQNMLFVGTNEGTAILSDASQKLLSLKLPGASKAYITAIFEDSNKTIWIGTMGFGVYRVKSALLTGSITAEKVQGINNNWITSFAEDASGNIWIGTRGGGVNILKKDAAIQVLQYSTDNESVSSNYVNCLHFSKSGFMYVGTYGGGLNATSSAGAFTFKRFTEQDGLPDNVILAITSDANGDIWFSTGNGISSLKRTGDNYTFRNFNELDGLQYKYNIGSVTRQDVNILTFGGVSGLSIFNPDEIIYNRNKPAVVITSFKLFEKDYPLDSLISLKRYIELSYNQNFISFEFSGLNYVFPDKNLYAYKLEGSDKDWTNAGNRRYVAYTNLDPGVYHFRVKAANNDGIWNEEGTYITVVIKPPFWRTWWFYILVTTFVLLSIFGIFNMRTRNLRRANILLEQRVKDRTQQLMREKENVEKKSVELEQALKDLTQTQQQLIQSEKMASLGQLTAGIAHEIKNPLNFVNNFSKISQELIEEFLSSTSKEEQIEIINTLKQNVSKINEHGNRANNIVSSMMMHAGKTGVDKQITDINKLLDVTVMFAFQGMRSTKSDFNCQIKRKFTNDLPKLDLIQQDIGRVILNLLNNAFYAVNDRDKKHEDDYEPLVTVSTAKDGNNIVISIRDNGMGIPDEIKEKIFQPFFSTKPTGQGTGLGLSLSYEIIKAHNGQLQVQSQLGSFTEFSIILPIKV